MKSFLKPGEAKSPPSQCRLTGCCAERTHLWFLSLNNYKNGNWRLARAITDRLLAKDCKDQAIREMDGSALGLSAQILRERVGSNTALERCQRGDLDFTGWLRWIQEQLTAAEATHGADIYALRRKAAYRWSISTTTSTASAETD